MPQTALRRPRTGRKHKRRTGASLSHDSPRSQGDYVVHTSGEHAHTPPVSTDRLACSESPTGPNGPGDADSGRSKPRAQRHSAAYTASVSIRLKTVIRTVLAQETRNNPVAAARNSLMAFPHYSRRRKTETLLPRGTTPEDVYPDQHIDTSSMLFFDISRALAPDWAFVEDNADLTQKLFPL